MCLIAGCSRATGPGTNGPPGQNTSVSAYFADTAGVSSFPPPGARTFKLTEAGQRDALHTEIRRQRDAWQALGTRDYRLLLREACFCPGPLGWTLLEIRGGRVTRAWDHRGRPAAITERNAYTVDRLFELLDAVADRDDVVTVGYDDQWHYPRYISTDARLNLPDDWGILQIVRLWP